MTVPGTLLQVRSDRQVHRPYGLAGGQPGAASSNLLLRVDGSIERMPPMFGAVLQPGDVFHHQMPAGGGFGEALERDPEAVAEDVREGKVSRGAAREQYGVVVGEDGSVDVRRRRSSARPAPGRCSGVKVARVEATPSRSRSSSRSTGRAGAQRGANLVLFSVHTDDGVVG